MPPDKNAPKSAAGSSQFPKNSLAERMFLNPGDQDAVANLLNQRGSQGEYGNIGKDDKKKLSLADAAKDVKKVSESGGNPLQLGKNIGKKLRGGIKEAEESGTGLNGGLFYTLLFCCVGADICSLFTVETGGLLWSIVNPIFIGIVSTVFFLRRATLKRWVLKFILKKFLGRMVLVMASKEIPIIDLFPNYTIMLIFLKRKIDQEAKRRQAAGLTDDDDYEDEDDSED